MKIAIFGGSFNPPHLGHKKIIEELLTKKIADEVWLVPVGNHHFGKKLATNADRLQMIDLLIANLQKFASQIKVVDYELYQPLSITYQTLKYLKTKYPQHQFSFVMGSDQLNDFPKWHDYQKLTTEFPVYVYPRQLTNQSLVTQRKQATKLGLHFLDDFPVIDISSTLARDKKDDNKLGELIGNNIASYVKTRHLY